MGKKNETTEETSNSDITTILNKRLALKDMTDEAFEIFLPKFCEALETHTFQQIIEDYKNDYLVDPKNKEWDNLKKVNVDKNYISSTSTMGMKIIKRHMPHIYDVKNHKGKCISQLWNKETLMKVVRVNRKSHSTPYVTELVRQVGFVAGASKVTVYRPLLTKRIVEYFKAKNVLDVCVGWGGRMLGSASVDGVSYTGIEPYSKTYNGLVNIKNELKLSDDQVTLYNDVAENVVPTLERKYDLALTSPPYYNLEVYSDESTQSHHYGSYKDWVAKFLTPVVEGVIDKLVDGGKSCWSVKNFKTDGKYDLYDDVVEIHKKKGWEQMDVEFYVGNCLRPGMKDSEGKARKSKEITYIFTKST